MKNLIDGAAYVLCLLLQAYFKLDAVPETETQFICSLHKANNYSHAEQLKIEKTCTYIPSSRNYRQSSLGGLVSKT